MAEQTFAEQMADAIYWLDPSPFVAELTAAIRANPAPVLALVGDDDLWAEVERRGMVELVKSAQVWCSTHGGYVVSGLAHPDCSLTAVYVRRAAREEGGSDA